MLYWRGWKHIPYAYSTVIVTQRSGYGLMISGTFISLTTAEGTVRSSFPSVSGCQDEVNTGWRVTKQ